ncbi:phosphate ABC transporter permease subunit PstC [Hyperthermus butylicus]|uniref:Phosphate transport system permease protein n=1 Tax=Hyperthermus butylicus (strain DSM 5456 / JCM 9403 / PLM1-5) TaxID=415426 RepID=A2BKI1_HYPBU|nr:phosphate ABC transporter permease subunit PstC [Hyperthermus butylicus]ABM80492.1 ABC-type phosphate transport, permease [Hyperthermus butylicus DSM 5456]
MGLPARLASRILGVDVSRMPRHDKLFLLSLLPLGVLILALYVYIAYVFADYSAPVIEREGVDFIFGSEWSPSRTTYQILPVLLGSMVTASIALLLALPPTLAAVVFINEYLSPRLREPVASLIDVMAGVPSVIYGLWGAKVLVPLLQRYVMEPLHEKLGFIPLFSCQPLTGRSILAAGVVLAIMVTPYMFALVNEAYRSIPTAYREAILGIGGRRYHVARILISMLRGAVAGAALLGFGRAVGETIAVTLVVGNVIEMPTCLFAPGQTITSLIATLFPEAQAKPLMLNALYAAGLTLLALGLALNFAGLALMYRWRRLMERV